MGEGGVWGGGGGRGEEKGNAFYVLQQLKGATRNVGVSTSVFPACN